MVEFGWILLEFGRICSSLVDNLVWSSLVGFCLNLVAFVLGLVEFGQVWSRLVEFGRVGSGGRVWLDFARVGRIWSSLVDFGSILVDFGRIWLGLVNMGRVWLSSWSSLVEFGCMGLRGVNFK